MKDCLHIVMLYRRQMMLVGKVLTDHFFVKSFIGFVFQCNALLIKFIEKLVQIGLLISFQLLLMRSFVQLCEIKTIYDNFDLISSIHMLFPFLCVSDISTLIHNISEAVISGAIVAFFSSIMESKGQNFLLCINVWIWYFWPF